jgi:hypothetical protein
MVTILQPRHTKLGLAGQARNWRYLDYELIEFQEAIDRIARLSPWVAEQLQGFTREPMAKLTEAVKAEDAAGFTQAFGQLTEACNQCHRHFGREEVAIRVPGASPFPNQDFSPQVGRGVCSTHGQSAAELGAPGPCTATSRAAGQVASD